eukprot:scaffold65103_cov80-Phaeocystis_antarctica.AAC.2
MLYEASVRPSCGAVCPDYIVYSQTISRRKIGYPPKGCDRQHDWSKTIVDAYSALITRARKRLWLSGLGGTAGEPSSSSERNTLGEGVFPSGCSAACRKVGRRSKELREAELSTLECTTLES